MEKYLSKRETCVFLVSVGGPENMENLKELSLVRKTSKGEEWFELPNGKFHGLHTSLCEGKQVKTMWKDGLKHGESVEHQGQKLISRSLWESGELKEKYDCQSSISWKIQYSKGKCHGLETSWIDGRLYVETEWVEGKMHGQQRSYNKLGGLHSVSYWEDDILVKVEII